MSHRTMMLAFSALILSACTSMPSPEGKPLAHMTFGHLPTVPLQVSDIIREPIAPDIYSAIPEGFTVPVDDLTAAYLDHRFKAIGGPEVLNISIEQLSVTYDEKTSENAVAAFFNVAKIESYDIHLAMDLTLTNKESGAVRGRKFTVRRGINITEHASIADREKRQLQGVEAMFADIDQAVLDILQNHFGL